MRSQLERAINLAARTGDKIIVVDELNDRSSVVMNLDDYERLLKGQNKGRNDIEALTEEELLDKINHDITSWKNANSDRNFSSETSGFHDSWDDDDEDFNDNDKELKEEGFDDEDDDFIEDDDDDMIPDLVMPNFGAPSESKDANENIITQPEKKESEESELAPEKVITEEPVIAEAKVDESAFATATVDEDENVYYYHEPESEKQEEIVKDESGFTSIKDELKKNKKAWAIPEEVKKSAEDVKN